MEESVREIKDPFSLQGICKGEESDRERTEEIRKEPAKVRQEGTDTIKRGDLADIEGTGSLREMIARTFPGKRQDIRAYSPLTLAFIGDVAYDLVIRTIVVGRGNRPVNDLHRLTVEYVSAPAQARIAQALADGFTEEEMTIYRRGKNAKPHTTAKNASVSDYLKATGFEAVIGYLYLTDKMERALELVKKGIALAGLGQ